MDVLLPFLKFIETRDWNSLLSALIGGGLALAGVFWAARLERKARRDDEKAKFQRETLIALQDAIQAHVRATEQVQFWRDRPVLLEKIRRDVLGDLYMTPEGDARIPPRTQMDLVKHATNIRKVSKPWDETRYDLLRLSPRIDNQTVRNDVDTLIAVARTAMNDPIMGRVNRLNSRLNTEIGLLIRRGAVTMDGFAAIGQRADQAE